MGEHAFLAIGATEMGPAERARKAIPDEKIDSQIDSQTKRQAATQGDKPQQPFLRPPNVEAR